MSNKIGMMQNLVLISQIGFSMISPIFIGLFIGKYLDEWLGTSPIFLFIFIIIGVGSAFMSVFNLTQNQFQKKKRK